MTDVSSNEYWESEFNVTEADLDRIEEFIAKTGQVYDLTALAKRIIRGRLRYGVEVSPTALGIQTTITSRSVRLWNPAADWKIGDQAIVAVGFWSDDNKRHWHTPYVGEVIGIEGTNAVIRIDALGKVRRYGISGSSAQLKTWRKFVEDLVAARRNSEDLDMNLERILLEYGDRIASQLLDALRADERFVRLAGCWFLRRLAVVPTEKQLSALAWAMLDLEEPWPTGSLLPLLPPPVPAGDAGLFGLYLALRDRPHLFTNVDPGQRPRWQLAGPPPGPVKACYAAYDPETYQLLCEPDEAVDTEVAHRLWDLNLFRVICVPAG